MVYEPQEWNDGDEDTPLSAARLLHMESGIGDAHSGIAGKADDSHTHTITDVSGLQDALDALAARVDALEAG